MEHNTNTMQTCILSLSVLYFNKRSILTNFYFEQVLHFNYKFFQGNSSVGNMGTLKQVSCVISMVLQDRFDSNAKAASYIPCFL